MATAASRGTTRARTAAAGSPVDGRTVSYRSQQARAPVSSMSAARDGPKGYREESGQDGGNNQPHSDDGDDSEYSEDDGDENDEQEEDDDEDNREDDDEDEESESAEEDPAEEEKTGFDEDFLAQLMAMDKMFANKGSVGSSQSQSTDAPLFGTAAQYGQGNGMEGVMPFGSGAQPPTSTLTAQPQVYPPSAPTPSNEFYDGAISFLTEVLGSSNPNLFSAAGTPSQGWTPGYAQRQTAGPSPGPSTTQFKNLQPLISNLIARLKGHSVEDGPQPTRISEEDLVVLLQSLMNQRQTQVASHINAAPAASSASAQANSGNIGPSLPTYGPGQSEATYPTFGTGLQAPNTAQGQGFSIVDFDFGDDDDDPDFVPPALNINYGNSADFAQALASVTEGVNLNGHAATQPAQKELNDDECWQKVLDEFVPSAQQALPVAQTEHRTRSTSKNDSKTNGMPQSTAPALEQPQSIASDEKEDDVSADGSTEVVKGKKRKLTKEEALARRRQVNRDCARRQRERKKQEAEELRIELERIEKRRAEGHRVDEATVTAALPLLQSRKPGRPMGSKNRDKENANGAEMQIDHEEVLDLRADNRMLRAEMQRLTEENAQLRARILRFEESFHSEADRKRKRRGPYADYDEEGSEIVERLGGSHGKNFAERFLAYQPFEEQKHRYLETDSVGRRGANRRPAKHRSQFRELDDRAYGEDQGSEDPTQRSIADVAAELVANPKAVERLVAQLQRQSSHNSDEGRPYKDTSRSQGRNANPSMKSNGNSTRAAESNNALHELLKAANEVETDRPRGQSRR